MNNELAQLLREAADLHDDLAAEAEDKGHMAAAQHHNEQADDYKQAAASLEAQEPVAWGCSGGSTIRQSTKVELEKGDAHDRERANEYNIPLYRHPPGPSSVAQEPVGYTIDFGEGVEHEYFLPSEDAVKAALGASASLDDYKCIPLYRHPPTSAVPEGWKLVPVEPTPEMESRGAEEFDWYNYSARDCYRAMLAAAPMHESKGVQWYRKIKAAAPQPAPDAITECYADGRRGDRHYYNRARIAWELERTALGDGYYGNALRVAKDLTGVTAEERSLLDRYATGTQTAEDHVALQDLALRIDRDAARGGE